VSVTQGELIRQEQEAGLVLSTHPPNPSTTAAAAAAEGDESRESRSSPQRDDIPHAGPTVVGVEDLGPQDGRGVEIALSNPNVAQNSSSSGSSGTGLDMGPGSNSATIRENAITLPSDADGDGDIILDDVLTTGKGAKQEEDAGADNKDGAAEGSASTEPS
jgi:hypothetical protein